MKQLVHQQPIRISTAEIVNIPAGTPSIESLMKALLVISGSTQPAIASDACSSAIRLVKLSSAASACVATAANRVAAVAAVAFRNQLLREAGAALPAFVLSNEEVAAACCSPVSSVLMRQRAKCRVSCFAKLRKRLFWLLHKKHLTSTIVNVSTRSTWKARIAEPMHNIKLQPVELLIFLQSSIQRHLAVYATKQLQ
jgi:hypothetical protein